ncbi:MAG: phosphoesterase [Aquificae bacterium]|nr:phosphoesterase [Aquificota bacterium]
MNEKVLCVYHKNCTDGTTAAAVLLKKFPDCKLFPFEHKYKEEDFKALLDEIDQNTVVYIVDFAFPEKDSEKIIKKAKKVVNIDHHIGAYETLKKLSSRYENFEFVFDNNMSGASLAYKYFFGEPIPKLVKLVEDKDIWKWEFKDETKDANSFLMVFTNQPEKIKELIDRELSGLLEKGKVISEYTDYLINFFVEKAKPTIIKIGDHKVKAFNTGLFQSEIGNILSQKYGEAVALFNISGDFVKFSFRSIEGQSPTALELAKKLGGGGHKHAAGAGIYLHQFCNIIEFGGENG